MNTMQQVWTFLNNLEGFEFAAFWVGVLTVALICGFVLDYVLQRQGFGPVVNALFILGGAAAGLYVRFSYLYSYEYLKLEPYLSVGLVLGIISFLLVGSAFLRNRLL